MRSQLAKLLTLSFLSLQAFNAFADVNLLDELKANKQKYSMYTSCKEFIQSATHETLKSQKIQDAIIPLSEMGYGSDYFFHYSPDTGKELRTAVEKQDFLPIVEYLFLYSSALNNVHGVGMYVAANPFSSAGYGAWQFSLKLNPKARMFDYTKNSSLMYEVIREKKNEFPALANCDGKLIINLILDENNVDISHYYYSSAREEEWSIILNEDIIIGSEAFEINSAHKPEVIKKMANKNLKALMGLVKEFNPERYHSISAADIFKQINGEDAEEKINTFASGIKDWNENTTKLFAGFITTLSQPALDQVIKNFQKRIPLSTYANLTFSSMSADFAKYIGSKIKSSPSLMKGWDDKAFVTNVTELLKKEAIEVRDIERMASPGQMATLVSDRKTLAIPAASQSQLIALYVDKQASTFEALPLETKFGFFNDFLEGAQDQAQVTRFMSSLRKTSYDIKSSFDYVLRRSSYNFKNSASAAFIQDFILTSNDPQLLNDSAIAFIISRNDDSLANFAQTVLLNRSTYGTGADKFMKEALSKMDVEKLNTFITRSTVSHLSTAEKGSYLNKHYQKLNENTLSNIQYTIRTLNLKGSDLIEEINLNFKSIPDVVMGEYVSQITNDPISRASFLDLTKSDALKKILTEGKLEAISLDLISKYQGQLFKNLNMLPNLPNSVASAIYEPSKLSSYMNNYSNEDKWSLVKKSMSFHAGSHLNLRLVDSMSFNPQLAKSILRDLRNGKTTFETFERFLLDKNFVSQLDMNDFESLVKDTLNFKKEIDLSALFKSDLMNLDRSLILATYLHPHHGRDNLYVMTKEFLVFEDLNESEKSTFLTYYGKRFSLAPESTRKLYFKKVIAYAVEKERAQEIVGALLSTEEKQFFASHYLDSYNLYKKGVRVLYYLSGTSFEALVLQGRDNSQINKVLGYVEQSYPVDNSYEYVKELIHNYPEIKHIPGVKLHMEKFICKKVNKHDAFKSFMKNERGEKKKLLKRLSKLYCTK